MLACKFVRVACLLQSAHEVQLSCLQITLELEVDHLIKIAEKAGQAIMNIYNGDATKWDVDHKSDDSPLTRADKEANQIICDALKEWTPHIPIISEEEKVAAHSTRQVKACI